MSKLNVKSIKQKEFDNLFQDARLAATRAGDEWMANASPMFTIHTADAVTGTSTGPSLGTMLDLCGNAHMKFKDKRSAWFKAFVKFGKVRGTSSGVIELDHKYSYRQEHGLKLACVEAARAVFTNAGVEGIIIWDYID